MTTNRKLIAVTIGLVLVMGAECVRAAVNHHRLTGTTRSYAPLPPAELDAVFQQKLVQRVRGPFERPIAPDLALAD